MKKRIISLCLGITIIFSSFSSYAVSQPYFTDLDTTNKYYNSIQTAYQNKRVSGTGDKIFSPNTLLKTDQFNYILKSYFGKNTSFFESYDYLLFSNEINSNNKSQITFGYFLNLSLKASGVYLFDSSLYNKNLNYSPEENAVYVLENYNLKDFNKKSYDYVTRGEAIYILEFLLSNYFYQPVPDIISNFPLTLETSYYKTYCDYLLNIPSNILNSFINQGWTLTFGHSYINNYNEKFNTNAIGLTSYDKKTIHVSDKNSIYHEFGHYVDELFKLTENYEAVYTEEKDNAKNFFRDYALTNSREYFADCFSYWIKNSNNKNRMDAFKIKLPKTYNIFYSLSQNNWKFI